jgi:hypothetical protein
LLSLACYFRQSLSTGLAWPSGNRDRPFFDSQLQKARQFQLQGCEEPRFFCTENRHERTTFKGQVRTPEMLRITRNGSPLLRISITMRLPVNLRVKMVGSIQCVDSCESSLGLKTLSCCVCWRVTSGPRSSATKGTSVPIRVVRANKEGQHFDF